MRGGLRGLERHLWLDCVNNLYLGGLVYIGKRLLVSDGPVTNYELSLA